MVFQEGGNVPFWMKPQYRISMKFRQCDETQLKDNTKAELLGNLNSAGMHISVVRGNRVGYMQDIYHEKYISVTKKKREKS